MRLSLKATTAASILLLALGAGSSGAAAQQVISGPSPFAGCDVSDQLVDDTNYLDSEVEPWVDVNPSNPNRLVAGWQQDRWEGGGARSLLSAYSLDGGRSWRRVVVPGIDICSGGTGEFAYDRASDPWVAVSPDGTSYFMSLSFNNDREDGGAGANAMLVSRSTDGGASWGPPVTLKRDTDGRYFNDKNAITADPFDSRYVYAVWDRLFYSGSPVDDGDAPPAGAPASAPGTSSSYPDGVLLARDRYRATAPGAQGAAPAAPVAEQADYFTGPALLARTADDGASWDSARTIYDPGINGQTIANQAVVLNNGDVMVFFSEIQPSGNTRIRFVISSNHGRTFSNGFTAATTNVTYTGSITPDRKEIVRDGNILFDVAIDRATGNLYLVWQDGRQDGVDRVAFSMSTNGGHTWSTPAIINKTPRNAYNPLRGQAFVPSVEVGADSKVYVTYYDFRNDQPGSLSTENTDYWSISCRQGPSDCRTPAAWGNETRLTARSFNILNAPYARGYFLGDYQGLARQGSSMRAVFSVATTPGKTDMLTTTIR